MKKNEMYLNRLLKVARRLGEQDLIINTFYKNVEYKCDRKGSSIDHFSWAIKEFPRLFKSWRYDNNGIPFLIRNEQLSTLHSTAMYFNLDADELFYLFVPGYAENTHEYTTASELSHHILDFGKYKVKSNNQSLKILN